MSTIGAFKAKTHFSRLLQRAEHGEEITITRRGQPVAKLVPATPAPEEKTHDPEAVMAAFQRMEERARKHGLGPFNWDEWKDLVNEGRP